ncbi:hypothetical protein [Sporomusa carbonis]|uniref:hypothetical protein n=1 Tax=Sporomusa carbonis TaxID=3076075 RepID=UPI003C7A3EE6
MVQTVVEQHAQISVLVNCAGVNMRKLALDYTEEDWDYITEPPLLSVCAARYPPPRRQ